MLTYTKLHDHVSEIYEKNYGLVIQSTYNIHHVTKFIRDGVVTEIEKRILPNKGKSQESGYGARAIEGVDFIGREKPTVHVYDISFNDGEYTNRILVPEDIIKIMDSLVNELYNLYDTWKERQNEVIRALMQIEQDVNRKFTRVYQLGMSRYGELRHNKGLAYMADVFDDIIIPSQVHYTSLINLIFLRKIHNYKK